MLAQNRFPVREIRIFESKLFLPAKDFDGATLEVHENQRFFFYSIRKKSIGIPNQQNSYPKSLQQF